MIRLICLYLSILFSLGSVSHTVVAQERMSTKKKVAIKKSKKARSEHLFYMVARSGVSRVQTPMSMYWTSLQRKRILPEGSLLQVEDGAMVQLEYMHVGRNGELRAPKKLLTFKNTAMVRLDRELVRRTKDNQIFFDSSDELFNFNNPEESKGFSMADAWLRLKAVVLDPRSLFGPLDKKEDDEKSAPTSSDIGANIALHRPIPFHETKVETLPEQFRVVWGPVPDPSATYHVAIWKRGSMEPPPAAITTNTSAGLTLYEYGTFLVKVTTADGKYSSQPHRLVVLKPLAKTEEVEYSQRIHTLTPPDKFVLQTSARTEQLILAWDDKAKKKNLHYKVHLSRDGRPMGEFVAQEQSTTIELAPGSYEWQVISYTAENKAFSLVYKEGPKRTFRIERESAKKVGPATSLRAGLTAEKGEVLYFNNGM